MGIVESSSEALTRLVIQLAVILFAAKIGGEICERYVRIPAVIGELLAGMIIGLLFLSGREILGPLFLGEREIPGLGLLFEHIGGGREGEAGFGIPVSDSLWAISQIGAIVLLFIAGLETDLRLFLRYAGPAILVAVGGVVLPFVFGVRRDCPVWVR